MTDYKIHIIDTQYHGPLPIATFLVESSKGLVLVETSAHSTLENVKLKISELGFDWKDIQHVLLTHIHLDHAGAAWCFAENGATVYLHPFGYNHMNDPSKLLKSATMIYGDLMDYLWGTLKPIPADQLVIVEDGEVINILGLDFKSIHSPGHAKHHIAWQLDNHLFAGDLAGICFENGVVIPPCPPPDINIEDWTNSIDKVLAIQEIDTYYITHIGKVTGDLIGHMKKLKKTLKEYAEFLLPYFQNQTDLNQTVQEFKRYTMDSLKAEGLSEKQIKDYEDSNSAIGSVQGILRYWGKKLGATQ